MANISDLNSRSNRIRVALAGLGQSDLVLLAMLLVRFFVYTIVAAVVHDYSFKYCVAVILTDLGIGVYFLIVSFKKRILTAVLSFLLTMGISGSYVGAIYVNGVIAEYLNEIQMRGSVVALQVMFIILLVLVAIVQLFVSLDVLLAMGTARHRSIKKAKSLLDSKKQMICNLCCMGFIIVSALTAYLVVSGLDTIDVDSKIYQVVDSDYIFYDYPTTVKKQGEKCVLTKEDYEISLASTPLYYSGKDMIIVPDVYAIIQPSISSNKKVENLSQIYKTESGYMVESESGQHEAKDFFLYDGRNTYIFFEETTITCGEKTVTISPFSYVVASYNGAVDVFNPEQSSCTKLSSIGQDAYVLLSDGTKLNVTMDVLYKTDGQEQMLFVQPGNLSEFID